MVFGILMGVYFGAKGATTFLAKIFPGGFADRDFAAGPFLIGILS